MRIKARPGLHYAPVPNGVYFAGARTQFVMKGWDLLFAVADTCVPLLEDGTCEDDLVAALGSENARPAVRRIIGGLRAHGLLLEPDLLTVPEPPPSVREQHAESLALLETVCAEPYAAFAVLRSAMVVLTGPPEATGPAARGLARAGVGDIVVREMAADQDIPADADAVLWCVGAGDEPGLRATGGRPVAVVPVLLDDRLVLAGPVLRDTASLRSWSVLRARALSWTDPAGTPAAGPPRPIADALAGSLAAQLLFEALTGAGSDKEAHVVHGADLAAERVTVHRTSLPAGTGPAGTGPAGTGPAWRRLGDCQPAPTPGPDEAVNRAGTVTARWTGLVAPLPGETLPQMPLALREAHYRAARPGSVVSWGENQQSVTVAVTLEALRQSLGAPAGAARQTAGAAGLTEETWLLDGALRLLTGSTQPLEAVAEDDLDPDALRYWRELRRTEPQQYAITVRHIPGLDWRLGRVDSADGQELGLAWGPDAATATERALGTALARAQIRAATGAGERVPLLNTDSLCFADDETIAVLRKQVCVSQAAGAGGYQGRRAETDPVLGDIPLWFGVVQFGTAETQPADAR
jgi:hypothetical protein